MWVTSTPPPTTISSASTNPRPTSSAPLCRAEKKRTRSQPVGWCSTCAECIHSGSRTGLTSATAAGGGGSAGHVGVGSFDDVSVTVSPSVFAAGGQREQIVGAGHQRGADHCGHDERQHCDSVR